MVKKTVAGVVCDEVKASDVKVGDTIHNPWSHNSPDDWVEVTSVNDNSDGTVKVCATPGCQDFPLDKIFDRRVKT